MDEAFLRTQMLLGADALDTLSRSHVIVFGLGGVGSYAAECLARSGVGELTLVDQDTLSLTNINRQLYALHSTVGQPKAETAAHQPRSAGTPRLRHLRRRAPRRLFHRTLRLYRGRHRPCQLQAGPH